ncbi:MAG: hypothetical protein Q7U75_13445, partial [Desulfobacterales bacterium]|nr:hypothetical protein [Desulfobacterales bacterium]
MRPFNNRLPATSTGCGIVVQHFAQIPISPALPSTCNWRMRCISAPSKISGSAVCITLPTGAP